MKQALMLLLLLAGIIGLTACPALAQRQGGPPPRDQRPPAREPGRRPPEKPPLSGRVLQVKEQGKQVVLGLYVLFPSPDAPGKAPDRFAEQAAKLLKQADELERKGEQRHARRTREWAEKLLCWREVEWTITPATDRIPILGVKRTPLADMPKGTQVRISASVEGDAPAGKLPEQVTLTSDVFQLERPQPAGFERTSPSPLPSSLRRTFFVIHGEVKSIAPLTIAVGEQTVRVDAPPQSRFMHLAPVAPRDIQPGHFVRANVRMEGGTKIVAIERLVIFPEEPKGPPEPGDDI